MGNWYKNEHGYIFYMSNSVIDWELDEDGVYHATEESLKMAEEIYPSFMISRATGFKVHTNWKLTRELTERLKIRNHSSQNRITMNVYDEIVRLNPILKDIKLRDEHNLVDICVGGTIKIYIL